MTRIAHSTLVDAVAFVLKAAGSDPAMAKEVATNLVEADLMGHSSHGTRLIETYVEKLKNKTIQGRVPPLVVSDNNAVVGVDARRVFGQIAGAFAVEVGVKTARKFGIAMVSTLNSGHFGRNGRWAELAAQQQMVSLHFVNLQSGASSIVPYGGREARLSSNPIAMGAPNPGRAPIVLDFAIGEYATNAVRQAAELGERLAQKCIMRPDGTLTDDPMEFQKSRAILPFGGFKGYGIGLFTEILAGAVAGGGCKVSEAYDPVRIANNMLSIFIDTSAFVSAAFYQSAVNGLVDWVKSAAPISGDQKVVVPGERSHSERARQKREGLTIAPSQQKALQKAASDTGALDVARQRWPDLF